VKYFFLFLRRYWPILSEIFSSDTSWSCLFGVMLQYKKCPRSGNKTIQDLDLWVPSNGCSHNHWRRVSQEEAMSPYDVQIFRLHTSQTQKWHKLRIF
jgi:hypothetical protein